MPCERKSVEPMAAITAPDRTAAQHQSLLHFVGQSPWSDEKVLAKVGEMVLPAIERHGPIEAWIIDDTGFPKQGEHSVGVARQYCGQLGKQDNCQVAVSLSLANHHASLPAAYRLYLPNEWAADSKRRRKTGVPEEIVFKTKPEIALEQIEAACKVGLPRGIVLMDAGYGCNTDLRTSISALALTYVAGIMPNTTVWTCDKGPLPPKKWSGRGRPPKRLRRDRKHQPISVKDLALGLPKHAWRTIKWREGPIGCRHASLAFVFVLRIAITSSPTSGPRSGFWSSGRKVRRSRPNTGFQRFRKTSRSTNWLISPSCVGESSAITRSSNKRLGSGNSKAEVGAASIIMPRCASRPTASWSPRGRRFPPVDLVPPRCSKNLPFPTVTDPEAPPLRTERHVPNSIATMRRRLIVALAKTLARCPCCAAPISRSSYRNL